ncbi:hypothetical protein KC318_g32 [Hortaea werneckii]|nr:hypothetical protein KC318_g32 [Hortaea werneckii]
MAAQLRPGFLQPGLSPPSSIQRFPTRFSAARTSPQSVLLSLSNRFHQPPFSPLHRIYILGSTSTSPPSLAGRKS